MLTDKESTDFVKLEPWGVPCDNQWAKDCMTLMNLHRSAWIFMDFEEVFCFDRTILGSGRATPSTPMSC
jgi:hypothetical protein